MAIDLTPFRFVDITIYYQQPKAEKLQNADLRVGCQVLVRRSFSVQRLTIQSGVVWGCWLAK
ncbi:hypothetical protein CMK13_02165 [Candidatus Poribacteria bacterium]|nr:hypothetical protein [Candidatus Poribacteria bacterium]OUT66573.1 MAG: hypothetical protein CBB75_01875 [bacterium TMED15]